MEISGLKNFISAGFDRWNLIKKDLSENRELSAYLKSSSLVVLFDYYQLDVDFAKGLDKPAIDDKKGLKPEELAREEFRQKMASYLENGLREVFLEARFPHIEIDLITALKAHQLIKSINNGSRASVRVVVLKESLNRKESI